MKEKRGYMKRSKAFIAEHQTAALLLDSYTTDELDTREQNLVKQHLLLCEECKKSLENILRFRTLLQSQKVSLATLEENLNYSLVPSVRQHLKMDQVKKELLTPKFGYVPQLLSVPTKQKGVSRKMRIWMIGTIAAILCICLFLMIQIPVFNHKSEPQIENAPGSWQFNKEQVSIRDGANVFAIKNIEISSGTFDIFYAFHSMQGGGIPQVSVYSLLQTQQNKRLTTSIQTLGTLGSYQVGVIQVPYLDRVGQNLVIGGKFAQKGPSWNLSFLKQLRSEKPIKLVVNVDQTSFPDISWHFGQSKNQDDVAFFQAEKIQASLDNFRIFVLISDSVKSITEAEYQKLTVQSQNPSPCRGCSTPLPLHDLEATVNASQKK